MTEAEWLVCGDPVEMVVALRFGNGHSRKMAKFTCAACRHVWHDLDETSRQRVLALEVDEETTSEVAKDVDAFERNLQREEVLVLCLRALQRYVSQPQVSEFIRDIFGNPFRPVTFDPNWRTSTAAALAAQMYDSRDFSAMPILADALQDAGCENAGILDHCRGPGPHVRGCWVVDMVLGKE
jgi:hypothetical protein